MPYACSKKKFPSHPSSWYNRHLKYVANCMDRLFRQSRAQGTSANVLSCYRKIRNLYLAELRAAERLYIYIYIYIYIHTTCKKDNGDVLLLPAGFTTRVDHQATEFFPWLSHFFKKNACASFGKTQACADRRADFTPFVCSTDGAVHREGQHFLRRLAARLATKWEMPYARVMNFVRTRLSIAILRATGHCVRGARRKFFSLSTDGGLAVALFS